MYSLNQRVRERINKLPEGSIFTFSDLLDSKTSPKALAVILSRLVNRGELQRLVKGRFAKARLTKFGPLNPSDNQILESLIQFKKNDAVKYISGLTAYNKLGLTTQTPDEVVVVGVKSSRTSKIGKLKIRFVRTNIKITSKNVMLLPLLDALRDAKKIPDISVDQVVSRLKSKIDQLAPYEKNILSELSTDYPPRVKALLGAIFEEIGDDKLADNQRKSLNQISRFTLGVNEATLKNISKWNIQ